LLIASSFEKVGLSLLEDEIEMICWWTFWLAETFMFSYILPWIQSSGSWSIQYDIAVCIISSSLQSLFLQGKFLRYAMLIVVEFMIGLLSEVFFETKDELKTENKEKEVSEERITNVTTQLQAGKRKKKSFKGKKKRTKVT